MVLSGQTIRKLKIFYPFSERTKLNGMSYGLGPAGYDIRVDLGKNTDILQVRPGEFILVNSVEHFTMPDDVLGMVADKSTWARLGLAVQNTIIEPGWNGYLTLEITNHSKHSINIINGSPIAQIICFKLDEPAEKPYNGKYQFQPKEPVKAILED